MYEGVGEGEVAEGKKKGKKVKRIGCTYWSEYEPQESVEKLPSVILT